MNKQGYNAPQRLSSSLSATMRQLTSLGLPVSIGFVSQMAMSFTDLALVSRLGITAIAGVSLALSVFGVVLLIGIGLIVAVSPKMAESYKREEQENLRCWYAHGMWTAVILGVSSILVLLHTDTLLIWLGQSAEIAEIAQEYNSGAAVGIVFWYLTVNLRGCMSSVGNPKPLTWIMLGAIFINLFSTYALIFGVGGFDGLGVFGAGLASTATKGLIIVSGLIMLKTLAPFKIYRLRFWNIGLELEKLRQIVSIGLPIAFRLLITEGFTTIVLFFIAIYGAEVVAAHSIAIEQQVLFGIFALGFSSAAVTMAAWARVEDSGAALLRLRTAIVFVGWIYALVVSILIYFGFDFIITRIFDISDVQTQGMLWSILPFLLLSLCLAGWGTMLNGLLVGLLDTKLPSLVAMLGYGGIAFPLGYILATAFELEYLGFWISMLCANTLVSGFNYYRVGILVGRLERENSIP